MLTVRQICWVFLILVIVICLASGSSAYSVTKLDQMQKRFYAWEEDKRSAPIEKRMLINFERNLQKDFMKRFYSWVNYQPKRLSKFRTFKNDLNSIL